jgi:HK97 gp10 family phage protein
MADSCIHVEGLDELVKLLEEQTPRAADRYLRACGKAAAEPVVVAMKANVPNTRGKGTGFMAEHIGSTARISRKGGGQQLTVKVGPDITPYPNGGTLVSMVARFLELGANTRLGKTTSVMVGGVLAKLNLRKHVRKNAFQRAEDNIPAMHFLAEAWSQSKAVAAQAFFDKKDELIEKFKD